MIQSLNVFLVHVKHVLIKLNLFKHFNLAWDNVTLNILRKQSSFKILNI